MDSLANILSPLDKVLFKVYTVLAIAFIATGARPCGCPAHAGALHTHVPWRAQRVCGQLSN